MRQVGCAALIVIAGLIALIASRVRVVEPGQGARSVVSVPAPPRRGAGPMPGPTLAMPALRPPVGALAVPVAGVARSAIGDSWGDARGDGTRQHHGTDIMAPAGTPVIAAGPGTIEKLFQSANGGTTLYERSADRQWVYYYAHLSGYSPGVHEGQAVKTGDPLGYVGDTGDAGQGNYHLHFGLTHVAPGESWSGGQDVNPYPLLAGKPSNR